ncbi:MAG TPA: hypothetical protein VGP93_15590 [Polyangiaceae bacterium]|nr:hypothetical protein [Polyangiaceae bacterium]
MTDDSLDRMMAQLAEGDRKSFAPVFQNLWPRVRARCVSLLRNADDADDASVAALH